MPTNQAAPYHENLTLSVHAMAPGDNNGFPLSYQWRFNGTNILGATLTSNTLFADTPTIGTYSVLVSNAVGSAQAAWEVSLTYAGSYVAPGTLAYHLATNAVGYAAGFSGIAADQTQLSGWTFEYYTNENLAFLTNSVWSTNFWLRGVQGLSATSIGYTGSNTLGGQGPLTMISPRHYICSTHMNRTSYPAVFLGTNDLIHWRTNIQRVNIPASFSSGVNNDISVGILNEDLPASVGYVPLLPADFGKYLPTNNVSVIQATAREQHMRVFGEPMRFDAGFGVYWPNADTTAAPFGLGTNWNLVWSWGDSGNPQWLLIGSQMVAVSHYFGGSGGPNYSYFLDAINLYMHYLSTNNNAGTDYQLTTFSLTNWPAINLRQ